MLNQPSNFVPKGRLKEFKGKLSVPESAGNRFIIVPVSDDRSCTDGGDVFSRWPNAEATYKIWFNQSFGQMEKWLGQIKTAQVQSDTVVASLLCKHGEEIDYEALEKAIDALGKEASNNNGSIHTVKFGDWKKVEKLIDEKLLKRGLNVNVYV